MSLTHALLLGLLQGATEFLPISSSGHLVLLERYLGLPFGPDVLQQFDIALHAGSLLAILMLYWKNFLRILRRPCATEDDGSMPLLFTLILGTIPAAIAGILWAPWLETHGRTPLAIGLGFLLTGVFLLASGFMSRTNTKTSVGWQQTLGMGVSQALALIPSVSRSGITLASGRFLGLSTVRSTEITFLLGAPALLGAVAFSLVTKSTDLLSVGIPQILIGFSASFVASLLTMHLFIAWTRAYGVWMWAAYLFVVGALVLGDEFLPLLREVQIERVQLPLSLAAVILSIALLLEAAPFTSFIVPGFMTMATLGVIFRENWGGLTLFIVVGTIALLAGNLLGYLPARQARMKVHWKEKADAKLHKAEYFFARWGFWAVLGGIFYGPIRSFISIAAGLGNMSPRTFLIAATLGSFLWTAVTIGASAYFGRVIW